MRIERIRAKLALRERWNAARTARPVPGVPERSFVEMTADPAEIPGLATTAGTHLERLMFDNTGRQVHKWLHYPRVYERYLAERRGTPVRMLELGVNHGGSLDLWRRYFGETAVIHGLDLNPWCAGNVTPPNVVHIGSQDDAGLLRAIVAEMGGVDVVLDDGSHVGEHQWASFGALFPLLAEGGLYIIEDLHTSYWRTHRGAIGSRTSGIALVEQLIADQHGWYHQAPRRTPAREWVPAIHVHDSIVVIEKGRVVPPRHLEIPGAVASAPDPAPHLT